MRKTKSGTLLYVLWRLVSKDESQLAKEKERGERKESMGLLLKNYSSITSHYRSQSQKTQGAFCLSRRGFHVEPGPREQALLAEDPSLKRFKSHKKSVWRLKRFGDVLTLVVVAGCCYEIYVKTVMREEARKQAKESA
ncbi:hypothetical protein POTOM_043110 [Populus tomentosa]|uniref:Uncharacterized protein n=1 Tax=Populus tomentosa TaxID=118781 RepID=A0A8X8C8S2_POPTO|nr:hypothetical protein POTOM_043110 [Populus tomentosa]